MSSCPVWCQICWEPVHDVCSGRWPMEETNPAVLAGLADRRLHALPSNSYAMHSVLLAN